MSGNTPRSSADVFMALSWQALDEAVAAARRGQANAAAHYHDIARRAWEQAHVAIEIEHDAELWRHERQMSRGRLRRTRRL